MGHRTDLPLVSCIYRFDPYQADSCMIVEKEIYALPEGTLHTQLEGKVGFLPYPDEEYHAPACRLPREQMSRVFIGQLPYGVTDMQLQWLCATFGNGTDVYFPERIVKNNNSGPAPNSNAKGNLATQAAPGKIPTGCVHAYCHPEAAEGLMAGMHKRILIDDTGVWFAENTFELEEICAHTAVMKKDKYKRPFNRPYDTVVAQLATSTYVPKPPSYYAANKTAAASAPAPYSLHADQSSEAAAIPHQNATHLRR